MSALETFVGSNRSSCFAPQAMMAGYRPEVATGEGNPRMQALGVPPTYIE